MQLGSCAHLVAGPQRLLRAWIITLVEHWACVSGGTRGTCQQAAVAAAAAVKTAAADASWSVFAAIAAVATGGAAPSAAARGGAAPSAAAGGEDSVDAGCCQHPETHDSTSCSSCYCQHREDHEDC